MDETDGQDMGEEVAAAEAAGNPFDLLTEEDMMGLEAAALDAQARGELVLDDDESEASPVPEAEESAADEAAESPEEQAAETASGEEQHFDLAGLAPAAQACAEEADAAATRAEQAAENSDLAADGDPKKAKKAAEAAREAADEAKELAQEAADAAADEDYAKAAESYQAVEEAKLAAEEAAQEAVDAAGTLAAPDEPDGAEVPMSRPSPKGSPAAPQKAKPGNPGYGGWAARASMR